MVQVRRQQMVDHVETLLAARIIDACDIEERDEAALWIVAKERHDAQDLVGAHHDRQLVIGDRARGDGVAKRRGDVIGKSLEFSRHALVLAQRSMVPVRRIFF